MVYSTRHVLYRGTAYLDGPILVYIAIIVAREVIDFLFEMFLIAYIQSRTFHAHCNDCVMIAIALASTID